MNSLLTGDAINSPLTNNVWFSALGTRLEIVNELGGDVCYRYTAGNFVSILYHTTRGKFINHCYCISKRKETLLGRLGRLSEYCVYPSIWYIRFSSPEVDLSSSYVILGKMVNLKSLEMMTDLEFEEIITTLTFTPNLL